MSKEDTAPGLLSKMVKFVRNPATNWSDLDSAQADRDDALSKQLLKEMIERKRRNDFVRKREFDMLRKLRKREAMVGVGQDPAGRPSFFQSSLPSRPDDRATTLKKIDEIEAQMSMQWWKTKNGAGNDNTVNGPLQSAIGAEHTQDPMRDMAVPSDYLSTGDSLRSNVPPPRSAPRPAARQAGTGYESTEMTPLPGSAASRAPQHDPVLNQRQSPPGFVPPPRTAPLIGGMGGLGASYESSTSGFSASKLVAMDVQEIVAHDAELEEAAIRFANGDDEGAEAGLLDILGPGGSRAAHAETWLTLFDLYRATGQQDKFESAALQFVEHFDRSAPQWFSMPDMVKNMGEPSATLTGSGASDWVCPSVVGIQTLAALNAAVARLPMPWRLDWSNLKSIDSAAVEPLYRVFGGWASQPVKLAFIGEAQLQSVLQAATPSGQRDVSQIWWLLRMEAMRVTHRPDDFELAALDFCVTYEVSPPAWDAARSEYKALDADTASGGQAIVGSVYRDSMHSSLNVEWDTQMDAQNSQMSNLLSVELSGQIQGDAIAVLDKLGAKLVGADMMLITCAKLIRVDFSAAGTLLNWVSERESENRSVQFSDVNRLVAAFFNVIGITEHARVSVRFD